MFLTLAINGDRIAADHPPNRPPSRQTSIDRSNIKHVIFIIKENRTYDQVLGDLPNKSNGDPTLVEFGQAITPNLHALAQQFVTLDNFICGIARVQGALPTRTNPRRAPLAVVASQ